MKDKIFRHSLFIGIELLLFIVIDIFIASLMLIFKISISKYYIFASLIISFLIIISIVIKEKFLNKDNIYLFLILYGLLPLIIIFGIINLSGKFYDVSCDGNNYHKLTVELLKNGWNPLYESSGDFDKNVENSVFLSGNLDELWINHYAKGAHFFSASVYDLTNNIESGKAINSISILALFLIAFSLLGLYFKKILYPFIFSLCVVSSSVLSVQFLTNYIDLLVYIYMVLLIFSFFYFEYNENKFIGFIIYIISLLMLINIKFSSFAYAGIYCLGFYIYYIVSLKKGQLSISFFKKFTFLSIVIVIVSVFIIGLSVYPKNLFEKGHPFYPLFGDNKVDIISSNQPKKFNSMSTPKKYFTAMFSKVDNIGGWTNSEPILKVPFTYDDYEREIVKTPDTRISGYGVIFGGIFAICVLLLSISPLVFKKDKKIFTLCSIILAITFMLIFFLSESWWARYFPPTYFVVLIILLYLYLIKNHVSTILLILITSALLYNNFITFREVIIYNYNFSKKVNEQIYLLENTIEENDTLVIMSSSYDGALFNIIDKFKKYDINVVSFDSKDVNEFNAIYDNQIYWKIEKRKIDNYIGGC